MTNRSGVLVSSAALLAAIVISAAPAFGQDRTTSGRARMELSFDHGMAIGVTSVRAARTASGQPGGDWTTFGLAASADLRLYAPSGIGAVVRTGYEGIFSTGLFVVDVGVAYRGDLVGGTHGGLQLVGSVGPSVGHGNLVGSYLEGTPSTALAGLWGSVHLDVWHRNSFVGIGVTARTQWAHGYDDALVSLVPTIRVGGDWGL